MPNKKKTNIIFILILMLLFSVSLFAGENNSEGQQKETAYHFLAKTDVQGPIKGKSLFKDQPGYKETDIKVVSISANRCFCSESLSRIDAMYMRDIKVGLSNFADDCENGGSTEIRGRVSVEYFDMQKCRIVSESKTYTLAPDSSRTILVVDGYVLAKKSYGIKAQVSCFASSSAGDCDRSNNDLEIHECSSLE